MRLLRAFILAVILGFSWSPAKALAFARPPSEKTFNAPEISQVGQNERVGQKLVSCAESPFGQLIRSTGVMAKNNPFRFSTKYWDDETDLVYYGYRYYNPSLGRWINRDPAEEEEGGNNLFAFVANNPVNVLDPFGRSILTILPDPAEEDAEAAEARMGSSLIQRVQNAVDRFNDIQDLTKTIMDAATGDPTDLLINMFQAGNQGFGQGLRKTPGFDAHHIFPTKFEAAFKAAGIDKDALTVGMQKLVHQKLHSGRGAGGGAWNRAWQGFLYNSDKSLITRSPEEIFSFGAKMMVSFGLF